RLTPRKLFAAAVMIAGCAIAHGQAMPYDVSSVSGGYTYTVNGSATDPNNGSLTRIAEAGRLTADGAGNMTGVDTVIIAGSVVRRTFCGTYTINSEGTGALALNLSWGPQIHADFVAADGGRILRLILTDPGSTLSGVMEAQTSPGQTPPPHGYNAAVLTGSYEYGIAGSGI